MFDTNKKTAQQLHARKRMWERHRIWLSKKARREVIGKIRNRQAKFLGQQSNRVWGFEVEHEGIKMKVLYDMLRGSLITVLPANAVWEYENEPAIANYDNGRCEPVSFNG